MSEKSEIKEKKAIEKRMCLMGSNEPVHTSNSQTAVSYTHLRAHET